VYSSAIRIQMENDAGMDRKFMRFEILLDGGMVQRQTVENSLALTHQAILTLSHGAAGGDEIWFTHSRLASLSAYKKFFGVAVCFEMPFNAVFMRNCDLALPIVDNDPQLYQLASSYISLQYPPEEQYLATRVRALIDRLLRVRQCTQDEVADRLCMHPRTLQRKLKAEGTSFEDIKDGVRRDLALQYLSMPTIPFSRVARMLGYSESTVFVRSCQRWFHRSPRMMREQLLIGQEAQSARRGKLGLVGPDHQIN
jgi:AraC-like DNA-binding protein